MKGSRGIEGGGGRAGGGGGESWRILVSFWGGEGD